MSRPVLSAAVLLMLLACLCTGLQANDDKKDEGPTLRDLSQDVSALQTLYQLQLTRTQLAALKELAKDTADKSKPAGPGKGNDKVRKALLDLRDALVQAKEPEKITQLAEALEAVEKTEKPMLND